MANRMKEDEKNERIIRGLLKLPANRRCINCNILESFERIRGRFRGEGDIESGSRASVADVLGMEGFFKQVEEIEKKIEKITTHLHKLQAAHEGSKIVTKASAMKAIKERMEKDVEDVGKLSLKIKSNLEELDRDNLANRWKPGCEKGTGVDRSRMSMTVKVVTVAKFQGGGAFNVIPDSVTIGSTFRAFSKLSFFEVKQRIQEVIAAQASVQRCTATVDFMTEERPFFPAIGWKLVYVDHENDVLLVGDDPGKVCELCSLHHDFVPARSLTNGLGW